MSTLTAAAVFTVDRAARGHFPQIDARRRRRRHRVHVQIQRRVVGRRRGAARSADDRAGSQATAWSAPRPSVSSMLIDAPLASVMLPAVASRATRLAVALVMLITPSMMSVARQTQHVRRPP